MILRITAALGVATALFGAGSAYAAAPELKSGVPVIYLADNLDEKDKLGWCIDTKGRGFADKLQAHSCKPASDAALDTQFSHDASSGQIRSVPYEGKCMTLSDPDSKEVPFHLLDCLDNEASQQFAYDAESMEIKLAGDPSKCVVVGASSSSAGPFMSRQLIHSDCATTDKSLKQWVVLEQQAAEPEEKKEEQQEAKKEPDGKGPGGPGGKKGRPKPDNSPESIAARARMGDTSTLMGSVAIPTSVDSCGKDAGFTRLVCLIDTLKSGASDELLALMQTDYSVATAKKWSNLPAGAFPSRPGAYLGELSAEQRGVLKAILMEAASQTDNEGFDEMVQTLNADDYIGTVSTDYKAGYSSFNTKIGFLGNPSASGTWQLYYGGHHFAFTNTYKDGKLVGATPSFRGIEPFPSFKMNGRTNAPLLQERDAFAALLATLTDEQKAAAKLEGTYRDILAGPQADDAIPSEQEGLNVSKLDDAQQALLLAAIQTYVGDINDADADKYMAKYTAELPDTVLGYSGTTDMENEDDYVRVHGPSLWLEFSLQSNKSTDEVGNHPHSVWRDRTDDYGGQSD